MKLQSVDIGVRENKPCPLWPEEHDYGECHTVDCCAPADWATHYEDVITLHCHSHFAGALKESLNEPGPWGFELLNSKGGVD